MKIVYLNEKSEYIDNLTITIGNFDGLHLGHQTLINKVLSFKDTKSAALTFNPHPVSYFTNISEHITTLDEKISLFENTNIDYLVIVKFDEKIANLSVDDFINYLKELGVKRIVVGSDFKFAKKASGSTKDLAMHFQTIVIDEILNDNLRISSTIIKDLIKSGNISDANKLLGHNYFINGTIEHGSKVGRTLGFPTANINYGSSLLPKDGVYITKALIDGKYEIGVTNLGNNPTINYSDIKKLEVYLVDYNDNLYNKNIKLEFLERIRSEVKFSNIDDLIKQMENDVKITKNYFKNNKI